MKILNRLAVLLLTGAALSMASCQDRQQTRLDTVSAVAEKIQEDKGLSQEEYATTLEYMEEGYTAILKVLENRGNMSPQAFMDTVRALAARYPYGDELQAFYETRPEDLDDENMARYDRMLKAREKALSMLPKQPVISPEPETQDRQ